MSDDSNRKRVTQSTYVPPHLRNRGGQPTEITESPSKEREIKDNRTNLNSDSPNKSANNDNKNNGRHSNSIKNIFVKWFILIFVVVTPTKEITTENEKTKTRTPSPNIKISVSSMQTSKSTDSPTKEESPITNDTTQTPLSTPTKATEETPKKMWGDEDEDDGTDIFDSYDIRL